MIINGKKLPDFFVVGAAKSGTTTLYQILKDHPEIFCPEVKEPEHFTYKYLGKKFIIDGNKEKPVNLNYITDFSDYCNLFNGAKDGQLIGDFSTHSLYHSEKFIQNLKEVYGEKIKDLKFIAILRHPVDRAISHYTMKRRDFEEPLGIMDAMKPEMIQTRLEKGYVKSFDYIGFSEYEKQVQNFTNAGLSIQLYDFSDLKYSLNNFVQKIIKYLDCKEQVTIKSQTIYNKSGEPRSKLIAIIVKLLKKNSSLGRKFLGTNNYKTLKKHIHNYSLEKPKNLHQIKNFLEEKLRYNVKFYNEKIKSKYSSFLFYSIYFLSMVYLYQEVMLELFGYLGYSDDFAFFRLVLSIMIILLVELFKGSNHNFLTLVSHFLTVFILVPTLVYFSFVDFSMLSVMVLMTVTLLTISPLLNYPFLFTCRKFINGKQYIYMLLVISVILTLPYFYLNGINLNLNVLLLRDIYEVRENYNENSNILFAYSYSLLTLVVNPIGIINSLKSSRKAILLSFVILQLYLFLVQPQKHVLFSIPFILVFYFYDYRGKKKVLYSIFFIIIGISIFEYINSNFPLFYSLAVRRALMVPAILNFNYFEFFSIKPLIMNSYSWVNPFMEYPFELQPDNLIAQHFYNDPEMNANNGIISTGYMNWGLFGVIFNIFLFGYITCLLNRNKLPMYLFGIYALMIRTLLSSAFTTTLLTHGLLVFIILMLLYPKKYNLIVIGIINYGVGNLGSIKNMLTRLGYDSLITSQANEIRDAEKVILPGVGNFDYGIKKLKDSGLIESLSQAVISNKTPILGICLGAQLMAKHSEEGGKEGLGWFDATVEKFNFQDRSLKIPHMGWNYVDFKRDTELISENNGKRRYYFVHSYHFNTSDSDIILGETNYGYKFPVILAKDNMYAVQFHPEKSHKFGMELLKGFASL